MKQRLPQPLKSQNRERNQFFKLLKKNQKLESDGGLCYLFVKELVEELINLQCDGNAAKPYQVKQVRRILLRYGMGGED